MQKGPEFRIWPCDFHCLVWHRLAEYRIRVTRKAIANAKPVVQYPCVQGSCVQTSCRLIASREPLGNSPGSRNLLFCRCRKFVCFDRKFLRQRAVTQDLDLVETSLDQSLRLQRCLVDSTAAVKSCLKGSQID